jgi:predicted amidophosphoribosyltransferase
MTGFSAKMLRALRSVFGPSEEKHQHQFPHGGGCWECGKTLDGDAKRCMQCYYENHHSI